MYETKVLPVAPTNAKTIPRSFTIIASVNDRERKAIVIVLNNLSGSDLDLPSI